MNGQIQITGQKKCLACNGKGRLHNIPGLIVAFLAAGIGLLPTIYMGFYITGLDDEITRPSSDYYQVLSFFLIGIFLGASFITGRLLDNIFVRIAGYACPKCEGKGRITPEKLTDRAELERKLRETEKKLRIAELERKLRETEKKFRTAELRKKMGEITLASFANRENVNFVREKLEERNIRIDELKHALTVIAFVACVFFFSVVSHNPELFSKIMEYPAVSFFYSGMRTGLQILSDTFNLNKTLNLYQVIHVTLLLWLSFGGIMSVIAIVRETSKDPSFIRTHRYDLLKTLAMLAFILFYAYEVVTKWDGIDNLFLR